MSNIPVDPKNPARAWVYAELDPTSLAMVRVGTCGHYQGMDLPPKVLTRNLRLVMVVLATATGKTLEEAMQGLRDQYGFGTLSHVAKRFPIRWPDSTIERRNA